MKLALQYGHGMKDLSLSLLKLWGEGLVILSPRDIKESQILPLAKKLKRLGGEICFDPQFYIPHSDLKKLQEYGFWPSTYDTMAFWSSGQLQKLVGDVFEKNEELSCDLIILPGLHAPKVESLWLKYQTMISDASKKYKKDRPIFMTIALSGKSVRDDSQIQSILDASDSWEADGYYVVLEHPDASYIVNDETWMTNALELAAGLKIRKKKVIFGYTNQQMLCLACANVDYIASGNWMNVRMFPPDKFMDADKEFRNKAIWMYSPHLFSEFKVNTLDSAKKTGNLTKISPFPPYDIPPGKNVYAAAQPSLIAEFKDSFFHYLNSLKIQVSNQKKSTFDRTIDEYIAELDSAVSQMNALKALNIKSAPRDISTGAEAIIEGLNVLKSRRRGQLKRSWK